MADPRSADLGAYFAASPAAIVELDVAGCVRAWNPEAERLFGWSAGDVCGHELPIVRTEDRVRFDLLRRRAMLGDSFPTAEDVIDCGGGTLPVRIWHTPSVDEKRCIQGVLLMLVRANERAQAQDRLDSLLDVSLDAVVMVDDGGRVRVWTRRATAIFGWTEAEAVSRPLSELIVPERHRAAHAAGVRKLAESGAAGLTQTRFETEACRRDGTELPVEVTLTPLEQPGRLRVIAFIRDISARKRAEQLLARAHELQRRVLESATDGIATFDLEARITLANRRLGEMVGQAPKHLEGEWICNLVCHQDRATLASDFARAASGESIVGGRTQLLHPAEGVRDVVYNLTPLVESDEIAGVVATATDVTEARRLEAEHYQAQRLESLGRLAGGIAHEFNDLMTAVFGCTELIEDALPTEHPVLDEVREIRSIAERATSLTRQLLDFARRRATAPKLTVVESLVRSLEGVLRRLVREGVVLRISAEPNTGCVTLEASQLEQVVIHLAANARHAMPSGGTLSVHVDAVHIDPESGLLLGKLRPGDYVVVTVTDTGAGMSPDVRECIFDPFYSTKQHRGGTGLGLATCYGIVTRGNGHIQVYSEAGMGTSFKVYLPRAPEVAPIETDPEHARRAGGPETLLVIEDDESVRRIAVRALRAAGYTVLDAPNGREGVATARAYPGPIHLVISDVVMPEAGGGVVVRELLTERPEAQVLLTSGYADDAVLAELVGPDRPFLPKPFSATGLKKKVRELLDAPHGAGPSVPIQVGA